MIFAWPQSKATPWPQKHCIKHIHFRELFTDFCSFLKIRFQRTHFSEGFSAISQNFLFSYPPFWDFSQISQIFLFSFRETHQNSPSGLKSQCYFHHHSEALQYRLFPPFLLLDWCLSTPAVSPNVKLCQVYFICFKKIHS